MVRRSWLTPLSIALLDLALDALAHLDEGRAGPAHLVGAARPEIARHRPPLAEAFRRLRQMQDRSDLVAQEGDGDGDEHERGADHPQEENVGVGGVGVAAAGEDAQHVIVEADADLDDRGIADRVEPERPVDLARDLLAERIVEDREERLGAGRRQRVGRQQVDLQLQPLLGDADHLRQFALLRKRLDQVDDGGDVAGDRGGKPLGHGLPVTLHEDEGDDRLEQQHRRDDDDERAGIKPLRHPLPDKAPEAAQAARPAGGLARIAAIRVLVRVGLVPSRPRLRARHACLYSTLSLYPTPRAVWSQTGLDGSRSILRRRRLIWTSMVRSPTSESEPISSWRGMVSPARSAKIARISCSRSVSLTGSPFFFNSRRAIWNV
jgi:hypothetical protein